ncbi:MAG: DNA polymerase III subunit gamma/tau [Candidatus Omnitrophota bacterium]|nr:DNA polymerase III subunit gamma/tau [Candidatus Omnitrophota bacterium]
MSYLVFARKYRPQNFDEIIGQESVTKSLKNAVSSGKVAHAYIFSGPRGVGKTSCARVLAKALNCQKGPTLEPCGKCPVCIEISEGRSMDVIEIDGASNRGIEDIRSLRENVKFASSYGKSKVYIIDEVHQITPDGFNALLKTLEEPPAHVVFVFATTAIHKVPPTILSRCQKFEFKPITIPKIIETLEQLAKRENIKIDDNALLAIARASDGSLRDAESLLDQLGSFGQGKISLSDISSLLGIVEDELLVSLISRIIKKDADGALEMVDNFINQGKDAAVLIISLIEYFRNLMVAKVAKTQLDKLLNVPSNIKEEIVKQTQGIPLADILHNINTLVDAQEMFRRIDSPRIVLEIAIVNMFGAARDSQAFEEPLGKDNSPIGSSPLLKKDSEGRAVKNTGGYVSSASLDSLSVKVETGIRAAKELDAPCQKQETVAFERIRGVWQSVIDKISKTKMSIATYLNEGSPLKAENNILFISFPRKLKFHKDVLEKRENSEFIEQNLKDVLGSRVRISFILSDELSDRQEADMEPGIKSTIAAFKGKIINRAD